MPAEDAMVWRVADELLYTRRVTDATYAEALAVLGERRLLSIGDDRGVLRVRVDAAQRRSLSAAGRRAAGSGGRSARRWRARWPTSCTASRTAP